MVGAAFQDHFSQRARLYATYRPHYPQELFAYLADRSGDRHRAWDCGTGNGQAAVGLRAHFEQVVASDASRRQIAHRLLHDRVRYLVALAEAAALADSSVDLATAAQALHWFDREGFYREVGRVVRRGGIVAVWGYALCAIAPAVDAIVRRFATETVGPYWLPGRRWVNEGYRTLPFPFPELTAPSFTMRAEWTLAQFLGYVTSWSAVQRCHARVGADPVPALAAELAPVWGGADARTITWPVSLRLGRIG